MTAATPAHDVTILCALDFECSILRARLGARAVVECCGPGARAVETWMSRQPAGARRIVLAGLAGALDPTCAPGTAHVVGSIVDGEGVVLHDRSDGVTLTTVDHVVSTPDARRALAARSGAALVDQESATFAREAAASGWDWTIVRGVSDGVDDTLPTGVESWVDATGRTRVMTVLGALLRRPWQIGRVMGLRARSRAAMQAVTAQVEQLMEEATSSILVFGGTFDPPHRAHVELPRRIAQVTSCDSVLYIPAARNPLKEAPTSDAHRLSMLRLALADVPEARISTRELDRGGASYTVATLESLRGELGPSVTLRLLMGIDAALTFRQWREPARILELATPAVMIRPPHDASSIRAALEAADPPGGAERWMEWIVPVPEMDISATTIRERLAAGGDVSDLLHPDVEAYIREHSLYAAS